MRNGSEAESETHPHYWNPRLQPNATGFIMDAYTPALAITADIPTENV